MDYDLSEKFFLSSENSINIARLLPQSFYYFSAFGKLRNTEQDAVYCVPSGNFGNLTAGLIARKMGLPVTQFIAAVNINDVFLKYLNTGDFIPELAHETLSNAMDVGNPSNFHRIRDLFNDNVDSVRKSIYSISVTDDDTIATICEVYKKYNYVLDPHGAVGYKASQRFREKTGYKDQIVLLETAHPAKFADTVHDALQFNIEIPSRLAESLKKNKKAIKISGDYEEFRSMILKM